MTISCGSSHQFDHLLSPRVQLLDLVLNLNLHTLNYIRQPFNRDWGYPPQSPPIDRIVPHRFLPTQVIILLEISFQISGFPNLHLEQGAEIAPLLGIEQQIIDELGRPALFAKEERPL